MTYCRIFTISLGSRSAIILKCPSCHPLYPKCFLGLYFLLSSLGVLIICVRPPLIIFHFNYFLTIFSLISFSLFFCTFLVGFCLSFLFFFSLTSINSHFSCFLDDNCSLYFSKCVFSPHTPKCLFDGTSIQLRMLCYSAGFVFFRYVLKIFLL